MDAVFAASNDLCDSFVLASAASARNSTIGEFPIGAWKLAYCWVELAAAAPSRARSACEAVMSPRSGNADSLDFDGEPFLSIFRSTRSDAGAGGFF